MRPKFWAGGALVVAGGILMVASGYTSRGFLYQALGYAAPEIQNTLSGIEASAVLFVIAILELLIALGGFTVIAGGLAIFSGHRGVGRALVFLGGGAGFLGLLISFGYSVYRLGFDPVLSYLPFWVGLALAIGGRHLAKGPDAQRTGQ
jgi:hypothetical protein